MATTDLTHQPLDLTTCDREPIHLSGSIQPHGVLLVIGEPELRIAETSANVEELLGIKVNRVLGATMSEIFGPQFGAELEGALRAFAVDESPHYLLTLRAPASALSYHAIAHRFNNTLILELELTDSPTRASFASLYPIVSSLASRLKRASSIQAISQLAAEEVRRLTGYNRVLIYRFDATWNGQVVGESRDETYSSYLHLWFPASDIPQQARKLYELNRLRLIADASYQPVPLVTDRESRRSTAPLDLSFATLRSVSPVHLEYLRNMGVASSMSISLLRDDGRLWGLIACHHRTPKLVPLELRTACDLVAQTVSTQLEVAGQRATYERRLELTSIMTRLLAFMAQEDEFLDGLRNHPVDVLSFCSATGVAVIQGGTCTLMGSCPSENEVWRLVNWLVEQGRADVYHTECLPFEMPDSESLRERASGLLAISISKVNTSYLLWFRSEVVRTVNWSGDPNKAVESAEGLPDRLHPRKSFEIWKEIVQSRSLPWQPEEIAVANELRNAVIGIVLKKAEELAGVSEELQRSNKELEAFSYSVSHDLRAPFRHILGYSELLKSSATPKLEGNEKRYLDVITQSANFAGILVENLLSFSQLGRTKLVQTRVDMNRVVSEVRRDLEGEEKGRTVVWRVGDLPEIEADIVLIRLVWQNLLQNALKYTKYRDVVDIVIEGHVEGNEAIFSVSDNGVGFEQAYADKLFGVFQRLHRAEDFVGTGIGLANVRRIVSRHGGRTWAEGEVDHGARFFFSLPHQARVS